MNRCEITSVKVYPEEIYKGIETARGSDHIWETGNSSRAVILELTYENEQGLVTERAEKAQQLGRLDSLILLKVEKNKYKWFELEGGERELFYSDLHVCVV